MEEAYAHAKIARECVVRVLLENVEEDYFSLPDALEFARKILRDNPLEFFNIDSVDSSIKY